MGKPSESKFGMTRLQIKKGYQKLREKGVENLGIHAFLASSQNNNEYYPTLARKLFELAVEIKQELGIKLSFVNLSGGIGVPYKEEEIEVDIIGIGQAVKQAYDEILVPNGLGEIAIYTELGRYMLAKCGALVTKVLHIKETYNKYIGVDACATNLMRPAMYGAYHHITVLGKENEPRTEYVDVVGGLCENNDKFAVKRLLPKVQEGDYLFIHDSGAHGFSMGYNYNGKLRSAELLLQKNGKVKLIRRAETIEDYFATLIDCE